MTTPPTVQAVGTPNAGSTAAVTYTLPTHQADDLLLLFIECGQTTGVPTPPAGWVHVANSPRAQGTNVIAGNLMWIRATSSSMTNPVVPAQANHQDGFTAVIRGVDWTSGNPFDTGGQGVNSNLSTTLSVTGTSTTVNNDLVVALGASAAGAADQFGAFTDASLTSVTKQQTGGTALGNAGSVDMVTGIRAVAGATGTMAATQASTQWVAIMVSVMPDPGGSPASGTASLDLAASGADQAAATGTAALTLAASGVDQAPASGSAAIALNATGSTGGSSPASGSAAVVLVATGTDQAAQTGSAALTLTASGTDRARGSGSALLSLLAAGVAAVRAAGQAFLSLVGVGSASGGVVTPYIELTAPFRSGALTAPDRAALAAPARLAHLQAPDDARQLAAPIVRRTLTAPEVSR